MSIFGKMRDAIFGKKAVPSQSQVTPGQTPAGQSPTGQANPAPQLQPTAPAQHVDVEQVLSRIASEKGNPDLHYKTSIADLMKLLDLDSSLENRKELATELGYAGDKDGSADMNIWLHKEVMKQLAAHGGKMPASLAD
ncbi:DUF3597 domain-containing protein [Sphingomonas edaphi]|uniref:DUF3597 domain-containing protein n=1 Tax=Sphingomonas edaphi TaxID=2315689 RepID=A0A418Q2F7_9SPHN|nr:DUF3597 domain-containing protein [Sphingomonas edaphi]RIX32135.1 DUF3597 domain-containing protein [Sphingomonas edaphi]